MIKKSVLSNLAGLLSILCILGTVSCSKTPIEKYKALKEKQQSGEQVQAAELTKAYLEAFAVAQFPPKEKFTGQNLVLIGKSGQIHLVYPKKITLNDKSLKLKNISFGATNQNSVILGSGKKIKIFDIKGNPNVAYTSKGSGIKGICLNKKELIFLEDNKLFSLDIERGTGSPIGSEKFLPPYKKYYEYNIIVNEGRAGVITGIAGVYYLSVIDIETQKTLIKNIAVSSQSFYIKNNSVYCIKGGSGNWQLYRYDINTKNKTKIRDLKAVSSFQFNQDFMVMGTPRGITIYDYENREIKPETKLTVAGVLSKALIIRHGESLYVLPNSILKRKSKEQ